jgi:MFS family permease
MQQLEEEGYDDVDLLTLDAMLPEIDEANDRHSVVFVQRNFFVFSLLFSVTHGTVDTILSYAAPELGGGTAGASGSLLYAAYTLTALLFARPLLRLVPSHRVVLFGLLGLLLYVCSFFVSLLLSASTAFAVFSVGGVIGGVGAGLLWPAQGVFFARSASLAVVSSSSENKAQSQLAARFASIYLIGEAAAALLATAIYLLFRIALPHVSWPPLVFGFYAAAAFGAVLLYSHLVKEPGGPDAPDEVDPLSDGDIRHLEVLAVMAALAKDRTLQLFLSYQISFGFSSGLMNVVVAGLVASPGGPGHGWVGALTALGVLVAAAVTGPCSVTEQRSPEGAHRVLLLGAGCFLVIAVLLATIPVATLREWPVLLLLYAVHGAGRGAWEGSGKAAIAAFFPGSHARVVAYAGVYFASGAAGAVGFTLAAQLPRSALGWLNAAVAALAIVTLNRVYGLRMLEKKEKEEGRWEGEDASPGGGAAEIKGNVSLNDLINGRVASDADECMDRHMEEGEDLQQP